MLFSSITFLFYFFPAVVLVYYLVPEKYLHARNLVLLCASLFFYAWGEPKYIVLMIISILIGYLCGLAIERSRTKTGKKLWVMVSVCSGIGMLSVFKYWDFLIRSINGVAGSSLPLLKLALPIGISFYTFQILSYTIDVYRGQVAAQKNIVSFGTYVSMFPQLIAGPIVRYVDIAGQLDSRKHNTENFYLGLRRFIFGLGKKILLANQLGAMCSALGNQGVTAASGQSVAGLWLMAIGYTLQIYFDFSGYSDMAIGLGKIFGFSFMENFNYPYVSKSITEFWRRWHMSLGQWFRDYVYIPLGGNRVTKSKWIRNIFIVWLLTGLWHGAEWTFVIWGVFYGVFLMIEKMGMGEKVKHWPAVLQHIYVLFFVTIGFVIFQAADVVTASQTLTGMFGFAHLPLRTPEVIYYFRSYFMVLIAAILGCTPMLKRWLARWKVTKIGARLVPILEVLTIAVLLLVCSGYLVDGSFNPFLYFRF